MSFGQSIKYNLKMPKPQNHYYVVEMELEGFSKKEIEVGCDCGKPHCYYIVHAQRFNEGRLDILKPNSNSWNRLFFAIKSISPTIKINNSFLTHQENSSTG